MDCNLPPAAAEWRAAARRFSEEVLQPLEGTLPPAGPPGPEVADRLTAARRAAGLWGLSVPSGEGGRGLSWVERCAVQEGLHRSLLGLYTLQLFTAGEPPAPLYAGSAAQRQRYLDPCLEGRRRAHVLFGVPGQPAVRRVPGGAVLDGALHAVPAFAASDVALLVPAAPEAAPAVFLTPGLPGYRAARRRGTMGSVELVDLTWERCAVPEADLLHGAAEAARAWRDSLRTTVLAAGAVGAAERCLEAALGHVHTRQTFGRPLADRQAIQWMIADSARELHAARLLTYRAAATADRGEDASVQAAAAQAYATAAACRVVERVIQMHGGYGYTRELPFERYYRELRYYRLAEGGADAGAEGWAAALLRALDG